MVLTTVARLLLSAVFATAGLSKILDRIRFRRSLIDFGVGASLAVPASVVVPLAELATALTLIPAFSANWGAVAALALLTCFSIAIGVNLLRGRTPDCHCFGQLHSSPIGWRVVLRNMFLAIVAVLVLRRHPDLIVLRAIVRPPSFSVFLSLVVVAVVGMQAWFSFRLFQQHGRIILRLDLLEGRLGVTAAGDLKNKDNASRAHGLPINTVAPPFNVVNLRGETVTLGGLLAAKKSIMLIFSSSNCGACTTLAPEISNWQRDYSDQLTFAVIESTRPTGPQVSPSAQRRFSQVLYQEEREVSESYKATATPSAVVVRPDGRIGSAVAVGQNAIQRLLIETIARALSASTMDKAQFPIRHGSHPVVPEITMRNPDSARSEA
jgi:thiol-disulfide isomerase/thioredoxin